MPNKMSIALAGSGGAVALGLVLMAVGTQAVLDDVAQGSGLISAGSPLEVEVVLDPDTDPVGVFAVQLLDAAGDDGARYDQISASVIDPFGSEVASAPMTGHVLEARFDTGTEGLYTLTVRSEAASEITAFGAIGPLPDAGSKALAFIPFYMLLAGIMGMAGLAVYWFAGARAARRRRG